MSDCKCDGVSFYDEDGHRCKKCFKEFVPKIELDEALRKLYLAEGGLPSVTVKQSVCWRNHDNIVCHCPNCEPVKEKE